MDLLSKETIGILSVLAGLVGNIYYHYQIFTKQVRPHTITFLIWTLTVVGTTVAQVLEGAGPGAWNMILGSLNVISILFLSIFYFGHSKVSRFDLLCLGLAALGIFLWWQTSNPIYAVLLLTTADCMGYGPTFVKVYHKPNEEGLSLYYGANVSLLLAVLAMEVYNVITLTFPIAIITFNIGIIALVWYRRFKLKA